MPPHTGAAPQRQDHIYRPDVDGLFWACRRRCSGPPWRRWRRRRWLAAFEEIANGIGPCACCQIGRNISKNAVLPPNVNDIDSGIAFVDIAYYLNHRKQGKVIFDLTPGKKLTGIGTYRCLCGGQAADPGA